MVRSLFLTVQDWPSSLFIRESVLLYPLVESAHVLMMAVFLGLVLMMDLRLVGAAFRPALVADVQRRLFPWQAGTLVVVVVTGVVLVYAEPMRFYDNAFFRVKLVLLALAALNAFAFHVTTYRQVQAWDRPGRPPLPVRVAGVRSILLWIGVVFCGRLIAYTWFGTR